MSAAAVMILRRKQLIRRFAERGATSPDTAMSFAELGVRRSRIFEQMLAPGVFVGVEADRYYLNQEAAQAFLEAQRRRTVVVAGIMFVLFVVMLLASLRR